MVNGVLLPIAILSCFACALGALGLASIQPRPLRRHHHRQRLRRLPDSPTGAGFIHFWRPCPTTGCNTRATRPAALPRRARRRNQPSNQRLQVAERVAPRSGTLRDKRGLRAWQSIPSNCTSLVVCSFALIALLSAAEYLPFDCSVLISLHIAFHPSGIIQHCRVLCVGLETSHARVVLARHLKLQRTAAATSDQARFQHRIRDTCPNPDVAPVSEESVGAWTSGLARIVLNGTH
jgi:hypothetical protein